MKTEKEIKDRLLKLYRAKEKFSKLIRKVEPVNEAHELGLKLSVELYTEKIAELEWVLN